MPLPFENAIHGIWRQNRYLNYHLWTSRYDGPTSIRLTFLQLFKFNSFTQSCPTLWPHEPQHIRPPCPTPTPRVQPNLCPLSWWCHPTISSSFVPFSSYPQSFPASNESVLCIRWPKYWSFGFNIIPSNEHPGLISFRMDWLDLLSVQGTLKSLLQHNCWTPTVQKYQFFCTQLSL